MSTGRTAVHTAAASPYGTADPRQEGPADLRLVAPAMAAWGAAAVALGAPAGVVATGCALAVALAVPALWAAVRRRRTEGPETADGSRTGGAYVRSAGALVALAAVLLCGAAGAAGAALHAADARRGPLPSWAARHAHLTAEVEVTGDPRTVRPKVRGSHRLPPSLVFTADVVRLTAPDGAVTALRTPALVVVASRGGDTDHPKADANPQATAPGPGAASPRDVHPDSPEQAGAKGGAVLERWRALLPTTRVRMPVRAAPPMPPDDRIAAVLRVSADGPPQVTGAPSGLQRLAGGLRAGLRDVSGGLSPDARALLPGLVVGDTSRVPPDLDDAFRATDLTHLLAVSGSNLTIVLALLIGPPHLASRAERRGLAPRLGLSLRTTALTGGGLALAFVVVCRPDPSVLRAAACGLITLVAIGTGRRRSLLPALGAAVLLLVLYDPWLARSYGFLLSVLATGALLLLAPRWSAALRRRRVPPRLAEVVAAAAAAQAVCAPVVAVLAARVGLLAVPCNLLAELAVAPATVLGYAALAVAPVLPPVARALAWCAGWPVSWIAGVARTGSTLPGAEFGWPGGWAGGLALAAVTVVLVPLGRRMLRRRWLCALCALALVLVVWRPVPLTRVLTGWPPPGWRVVACDVGQGDGLVLAAGDGTALVVDAGPEPRAVDRCLTALGVRSVPVVLLSHFHADHVDGLPGVLRGRSVGLIETTTLREPPGQAEFVRRTATEAGVPVVPAVPGERRRLGQLSWEVLWPPADGTGDVTGPNDASVTLLVRSGDVTLMLLGDLEPPAQQALLASHPELTTVDVLKVAHHGSAHQDPTLLQRLAPRLALISVGADNPYGHPAPRTVDALRRGGAVVLRTDTGGALAVLGTHNRLSVTTRGRRARESRGLRVARRRRTTRCLRTDRGFRRPRAARPFRNRPARLGRSPPATPLRATPHIRRRGRPAVVRRSGRPGPRRPPATVRPRRRPPRPGRPVRAGVPRGRRSVRPGPRPLPRRRRGRAVPVRVVHRSPGHCRSAGGCAGCAGRRCQWGVGCWNAMARKSANDDPLAPVTLAVGQEDLLLDRAVQQVVAAARAADADTDVRDLTSDQLQPGTLAELTSPSLFAERKVVVVRNSQDLSADSVKDVKGYLASPAEEITLVLLHAGGAKGKGLLDAARKAGAREVACPKMTKPADRLSFVRGEFRAVGRSATPEACQALVDAIGSDLRELASACSQLAADIEGTIDEAVVARYYTGRAEASSFTVADRAVEGRAAEALEALRWSIATGVAPVMITSALAQGVRAIGKLASAPRGARPGDLARELGMPPWKIDRVRQQMRGWSADGVATALRAVAAADAGVKGGGDDPEYALEKAVVAVARAARSR